MRSLSFLRLFQLLLVVCMLGILTFRITVWVIMYNTSSGSIWSSIDDGVALNDSQTPAEHKHFYISLCNVNIARASKIFNDSFSLDFFDHFSQSVFAWQQDPSNHPLPSHSILNSSAHEIKDMLKLCRLNSRGCTHKSFHRHLTRVGVCYSSTMNLTDVKSMKLVLDPEEFDYLLPNQGLVGFTMYVHSTGPEDSRSFSRNMVPVGPGFETIVQVKIQRSSTNVCGPQLLCLIRRNCNKGCHRRELRVLPGMITQALRLPYYMHLVSHAFLKDSDPLPHQRMTLGLSLQQRSYLRATNRTLFHSISTLAITSVGALRKVLTKIDSVMEQITALGTQDSGSEDDCGQTLSLPLSRLLLMAWDYIETRRTKDLLEGHYLVTSRHSQLYLIHCFFSGQRLHSPIQFFLATNIAVLSNFKVQLQNKDLQPPTSESGQECASLLTRKRLSTLGHNLAVLEVAVVHFLDQLKLTNANLYEMATEQRAMRAKFPSIKDDKIRLSPERLVSLTMVVDGGHHNDPAPITDPGSNQVDLGNLINSLLTTAGFCLICIMFLSKTCEQRGHQKGKERLRPHYRPVHARPRMTDPQSTEQFSDTSAS